MKLLNRRLLLTSGLSGVALTIAGCTKKTGTTKSLHSAQSLIKMRHSDNPIVHITGPSEYFPEPDQHPVKDGMAKISNTSLWYWDTGGKGEAVILLHPATGSSEVWGYQQPVLAKAGYRVISYSRRGHYRSITNNEDHNGTMAGDLAELLDFLGVSKCHLIGAALGGAVASDFCISYPERVLSLTWASSLCGIDEQSFRAETRTLLPPNFKELPADFRELSPSYRVAHKEGTQRWLALEKYAHGRVRQKKDNFISFNALGAIKVPILIFTGAADLYFPPSRLKALLPYLHKPQAYIVEDVGHAIQWEKPAVFNQILLNFLPKSGSNL